MPPAGRVGRSGAPTPKFASPRCARRVGRSDVPSRKTLILLSWVGRARRKVYFQLRAAQSRAAGAELYASLLESHGFASAYTSSGKWITSPRQMQRYIMSFGPSGYFSQEDVWLGRNASLIALRASEAQLERDTGVELNNLEYLESR